MTSFPSLFIIIFQHSLDNESPGRIVFRIKDKNQSIVTYEEDDHDYAVAMGLNDDSESDSGDNLNDLTYTPEVNINLFIFRSYPIL